MLAGEGGDNVACKMCPVIEDCGIESYLSIAQVYKLFYHIRANKGYRMDFSTSMLTYYYFCCNEYITRVFKHSVSSMRLPMGC